MIYEGAIVRRLVTPNHPGDPTLDDPAAAIQCRVEYVRNDPPKQPGDWTKEVSEAFRYPRHLEAAQRAEQLGGMAHARVMTADGREPFSNFSPSRTSNQQGGEAASQLAYNQKIAGSSPASATNLPADNGARPAGKTFSKKSRLAALRAAAKRVRKEPDQTWYRKGQYA